MCTVCGCGPDQVHIDGQAPGHFNYRALGRKPAAGGLLLRRRLCRPVKGVGLWRGPARAHAPGLSQARMVKIEQDILSKTTNTPSATAIGWRSAVFGAESGVQPRFGQDHLLAATVARLLPQMPVAVIEGDQQTSHDAERIRAAVRRRCRSTPARAAIWMGIWWARRCNVCRWTSRACCLLKTSAIWCAQRRLIWGNRQGGDFVGD